MGCVEVADTVRFFLQSSGVPGRIEMNKLYSPIFFTHLRQVMLAACNEPPGRMQLANQVVPPGVITNGVWRCWLVHRCI